MEIRKVKWIERIQLGEKMKAFIASVKDIFLNEVSNEAWKKEKMLKIPLYQREYEWNTDNVSNLVQEIFRRNDYS